MSERSVLHHGLTDQEVAESRKRHGANVLTPPERDPWWRLFLQKFDDPIIRILMIAAVIAIAVGVVENDYLEGVGIVIAIILATFLAFINEYKAGKEFDILNKVSDDVDVQVIRNGVHCAVPRKDLVVGDVALLELGAEIPADGEVVEAVSLQVDESRLTGESVPVTKRPGHEETPRGAYPKNRVLRGCLVRDGHGVFIVDAVGDATEIGKTIEAVTRDTGMQTPLSRQLERLGKFVGVIGFGAAALLFLVLTLRGVWDGNIEMQRRQWLFAGLALASVAIILIKIWLPIVLDALSLFKVSISRPRWLTETSVPSVITPIIVGIVFFACAAGALIALDILPSDPALWMPSDAARAFLGYFMLAVALIVMAVPEGLGMSVTLSLALSMRKMTAANNLVRRMHACETIGAATVICSDKTGTLTRNEMRVQALRIPCLEGGDFRPDNELALFTAESMAANSTANLGLDAHGSKIALGNPTEGALILNLDEKKFDYAKLREKFVLKKQLAFSTERKYMATLGLSGLDGACVLFAKGAPEIVLSLCSSIREKHGTAPLDEPMRVEIRKELLEWQKRGMRTLGFAFRRDVPCTEEEDLTVEMHDLIWLGFAAIADPVRDDVPDAVAMCRNAGIEIKIVTGDVAETAREIGRRTGVLETDAPGEYVSGQEFGAQAEETARKTVEQCRLFYRARPLDKQKLVKCLQENGHVVAVTGDGTNDGPALNHADVGIAMGRSGTAVAKEASDIILLDDSFASIVKAVMWGRSLYENIQRFILFQLTINFVALTVALLAPFIGLGLPFTVTQVLWINLIMDTLAALALASEPPHWYVMERAPRKTTDFIISPAMAKRIVGVGCVFLIFMLAFLHVITRDGTITTYELTAFFTTFVMLQVWNIFNVRAMGGCDSALRGFFDNKPFVAVFLLILALQFAIVQWGGAIFRTTPLSLKHWAYIVVGTSLVLWGGEVIRFLKRKRKRTCKQAVFGN